MKNLRTLIFYLLIIGVFSVFMYVIVYYGQPLEEFKVHEFKPQLQASNWQQFKQTYHENITHPLAILLLQIIAIIITARFFGFICKKIRQPTVIGEMAAGIVLGPSIVGTYLPDVSGFLFPADSIPNLQFLSQIGLILFMFIVGMELDMNFMKNKAHEAVVVSHASIVIPFALGMGLAYFIYLGFAPPNVKFLSFSLFMGIAMSITAFPVLARIVQEKGLTKTRLGTLVITCAAADDVTAWCILAVVIAIAKAGAVISALFTLIMAIVYVILMLQVVRPFLKRLGNIYSNKESMSKPVVAIFFITLLISSCLTEVIGIHALFGAFMAGVIMPSNMNFRNIFIEKIEDVAMVLLLPLFFVYTGLRTQIGLLNDVYMWEICGAIILVAVVGKFFGSALAAKFVGENWRDSLTIGALMNTRGLMELVVLNIGLDMGVISREIFTMMVIMALVTTLMTSPALELINWLFPKRSGAVPKEVDGSHKFKILIPFGNPERGLSLLRLANSFVRKSKNNSSVTALHLSPSNELHQYNEAEFEQQSFEPIREEAGRMDLPIKTVFKASPDIDKEITDIANEGKFDLTVVGLGRSIFEGTLLGRVLGFTNRIINPEKLYDTITGKEKLFETSAFDDRTRSILRSSKVPVGIFIDKDLQQVEHVIIPVFSVNDSFLFTYAQKLIHNNESHVTIVHMDSVAQDDPELKSALRAIEQKFPQQIKVYNEDNMVENLLEKQDLMMISLDSWKKAVETQSVWLSFTPSTLIIKP